MTIQVQVTRDTGQKPLLIRQQMRRCDITNGELVYGEWTENVPPERLDGNAATQSRSYTITDTSRIVLEENGDQNG